MTSSDCCEKFIALIKQEVKPALGCTEPIAVALAVAKSAEVLKENHIGCEKIIAEVSGNILKNGMGVGVPGTGMVGLHIASALAAVCGKSSYLLEVLKDLTPDTVNEAKKWVEAGKVEIRRANTPMKLYIKGICEGEGHRAETVIEMMHDNIVSVVFDGNTIYTKQNQCPDGASACASPDVDFPITVRSIYDFATSVPLEKIEFIYEAARLNTAIAHEGLAHEYGLCVGRTICSDAKRSIFGDGIMSYSMSLTAAASDARMDGCTLPAMSNSGSGNQGITVTMPVVATAERLGSSHEQLIRALTIAHLTAIHIKHNLGRLSALCGCVVASSGASCGIVYLMGGGYDEITYSIKNMAANITGMVCDGAKIGCALKVASGVASAVQAAILAHDKISVTDNDGIIDNDIEKTIANLGLIGSKGMSVTDDVILDIMIRKKNA